MNQNPLRAGGPEPEQPRHEPEIIPPGGQGPRGGGGHSANGPDVFIFVDQDGRTHQVKFKRPGPFTIALILFAIALVVAAFLAVVVGALFVLVPIVGLIVLGAIGYAYARGFWQRLRGAPPTRPL